MLRATAACTQTATTNANLAGMHNTILNGRFSIRNPCSESSEKISLEEPLDGTQLQKAAPEIAIVSENRAENRLHLLLGCLDELPWCADKIFLFGR